jgi:hypothetical protein
VAAATGSYTGAFLAEVLPVRAAGSANGTAKKRAPSANGTAKTQAPARRRATATAG